MAMAQRGSTLSSHCTHTRIFESLSAQVPLSERSRTINGRVCEAELALIQHGAFRAPTALAATQHHDRDAVAEPTLQMPRALTTWMPQTTNQSANNNMC